MPKRTSLLRPESGSVQECDSLLIDHALGGPSAARRNLRSKLEQIGEEVAALLNESSDSHERQGLLEIDVAQFQFREQIKEVADQYRRYFGTLAGLLQPAGFIDDVHSSSMELSRRCVEIVFMSLLLRNVMVTTMDETVYRSCLGILTAL